MLFSEDYQFQPPLTQLERICYDGYALLIVCDAVFSQKVYQACPKQKRLKNSSVLTNSGRYRLLIFAGMMELVDIRDLGSRAIRRWGSSPHARTSSEKALRR